MNDRGVTPVVGKTLEIIVVVLYVSIVTGVLYGGVIPAAQSAGGAAHADQVLATAGAAIDGAVPESGHNISGTYTVSLPATIAGEPYTIHWNAGTLVLDHPDATVRAQLPLILPDRVQAVRGTWTGDTPATVVVNTTNSGVIITLMEGGNAH